MCKTILSVLYNTLSKANKVMMFSNPCKGLNISHSVKTKKTKNPTKKNICKKKKKKFMNEFRGKRKEKHAANFFLKCFLKPHCKISNIVNNKKRHLKCKKRF